MTILENSTGGRRGSLVRDAVLFKIADAAGLPITTLQPQISAISGGGSVQSILSYDTEIPGLYGANLFLGQTAGANVFRIQAGEAVAEVSIVGQ